MCGRAMWALPDLEAAEAKARAAGPKYVGRIAEEVAARQAVALLPPPAE
jgi:hypothetical protein